MGHSQLITLNIVFKNISDSVVYGDSNRVICMVDGSQSTMPTLTNCSLTNGTFIEKLVLSNDLKTRKLRMYTLATDRKRLTNIM